MATSGFDGKIEVQTGGSGSLVEINDVTDLTADPTVNLFDAGTFGDTGTVRIAGRTDLQVSATFHLDIADTTHKAIFDDAKAGTENNVRVTPDRNVTSDYVEGTCKVSDISISMATGSITTATVTWQISDGNAWTIST